MTRTAARPGPRAASAAGLDPRRPLVVDTRPLGRRPGSMWTTEQTVPAPEPIGLDLLHVPAGAPVELTMRLEAVLDGVLATVDALAPTRGECARCLEPLEDEIEVHFTELYSYPEQTERFARIAGLEPDEDDQVSHLYGDLLDLEQPLRDAIVLALPSSPLCQDDCPGLCVECGERLSTPGEVHDHSRIDPRWAALSGSLPADQPAARAGSASSAPAADKEEN